MFLCSSISFAKLGTGELIIKVINLSVFLPVLLLGEMFPVFVIINVIGYDV